MKRILLSLMVLVSTMAHAQSLTQTFDLKNGLKLIVREDHRAPVVVTQIWYGVGSSYEPPGLTGISHVLEHMMFKGTKAYPEGAFNKLISENGGEQNAFTYYDYTAYYQKLRSNLLPLSFKLEADRMRNLVLTEEPFKKEMNVVTNERLWRTDDKPERLAEERFLATAYLGNPYQNPVIGWMDDIQSLRLEDVHAWYQAWYRPNNATVVVVGDVQAEEVYQLALQHFGEIPKGHMNTLKKVTLSPAFGRRQIDIKLPTRVSKLFMGYNVPSFNVAEQPAETYALEVLMHILDGGKSARLEKELVRKQRIATGIQTSYPLYSLHPTLLQFSAVPTAGNQLEDLETAFLAEIEKIKSEPIDNKEFERVKTNVIATHLYSKDSMFYQAYEIGALEVLGLSWEEGTQYVKNIMNVTPKQVQEVAIKYLTPERLTVAYLTASNEDEQGAKL